MSRRLRADEWFVNKIVDNIREDLDGTT